MFGQEKDLDNDFELVGSEERLIKVLQELTSIPADTFKCGEKAIIYMGPSGVGKSTLLNYLIQPKQLYAEEKDEEDSLSDQLIINTKKILGNIDIGHETTSKTTIPSSWEDENSTVHWDCPGFRDTRGTDQDLANAFYMTKLFESVKDARIVLVLSTDEIGGTRSEVFLNSLKEMGSLFIDLDSLKKGIFLIVTKMNKKHDAGAIRKRFLKILKDHKNTLDPKQEQLLEFFASEESKIGCFPMPENLGDIDPEGEKASKLNKFISDLQSFSPKIKIALSSSHLNHLDNFAKKLNGELTDEFLKANRQIAERLKESMQNSASATELKTELKNANSQLDTLKLCNDPHTFAKRCNEMLRSLGIIVGKKLAELVKQLDLIKVLKPDIDNNLEKWVSQFKVINTIQKFLGDPDVKYNPGILHIESPIITSGQVMKIFQSHHEVESVTVLKDGQIVKEFQAHQEIESVTILSMAFYLDSKEELKLPGINLQIITERLYVPAVSTTIDLSGKNGALHAESKAPAVQGQNFDGSGLKGNDGLPGLPGGNGGNLYLSAKKVFNSEKLTVNVSGGKGGEGQDGGDGAVGAKGADGSFDDVNKRSEDTLMRRHEIEWSERKGFWESAKSVARGFTTFNGQVEEDYESLGKPGLKGGDGGSGGAGGIGGNSGMCLFDFEKNAPVREVISNKGYNGLCGLSGKPGKGGADGTTWRGVYVNEMAFPSLREAGKAVDKSDLEQQDELTDEGHAEMEAHEPRDNVETHPKIQEKIQPLIGTTVLTAGQETLGFVLSTGANQVLQQTAAQTVKTGAVEISKKAAQEGVKEAGKKLVQEGAKEAGKKVFQEGAKEAGKKVVQEGMKEAGKKAVQEGVKEAGKKVVQEGVKEVGKKAVQEGMKEAGKKAIQEGVKEAGKKVVQEGVKEAGKKAMQEGVKEAGKKVIQEGAKEAGKKLVQEGVKEGGKKAVQEGLKEAGKKVVQEGVKEAGKKAAQETAKQAGKKVIQTGTIAAVETAEVLATTAVTDVAVTSGWSMIGGALTSLGLSVAIQSVTSLASSYLGSGWKVEPYPSKGINAPSGMKSDEINRAGQKFPSKSNEISKPEIESLTMGYSQFIKNFAEIL